MIAKRYKSNKHIHIYIYIYIFTCHIGILLKFINIKLWLGVIFFIDIHPTYSDIKVVAKHISKCLAIFQNSNISRVAAKHIKVIEINKVTEINKGSYFVGCLAIYIYIYTCHTYIALLAAKCTVYLHSKSHEVLLSAGDLHVKNIRNVRNLLHQGNNLNEFKYPPFATTCCLALVCCRLAFALGSCYSWWSLIAPAGPSVMTQLMTICTS